MSALLLVAAGCGGGIGSGAVLTVYVSAPLSGRQAGEGKALCASAKRELARSGHRVGRIRVQAVCLDDSRAGKRWSLAAVGANARRATEDSTAIGYIGELDPAATRFSRPIVEGAGLAQVSDRPGAAAMAILLRAVREAGESDSMREAVREKVAGG